MQQYYLYIAIIFFIGVLFWAFNVTRKYSKKKKLPEDKRKEIIKNFSSIMKHVNNPKSQIIDYDKLYHKILKAYGYKGTFGEILKKQPNEIGDIDKVWKLHKTRNKLVHEFDLLSVTVLKKYAEEYEEEIRNLLK